MEKIAIIFGGKSVEHDISIITGLQMMKIAKKNYDILPIYIDSEGVWWTAKNMDDVRIYHNFKKDAKRKKSVLVEFGKRAFIINKKRQEVVMALVCLHGLNGEDGFISAVLEGAGICYSCSNILSSVITMDKEITKIVLSHHGIKNTNFVSIKRGEKLNVQGLKFPLIVKPANLGSSIGISVAKDEEELKKDMEIALNFDNKVLIEEYLESAEEFNCACFKYNQKYFVSNVIQVEKGDIFSFDEKYLNSNESKNLEIDFDLRERIKELTAKVYEKLECFGVVRVDFLYKDDQLYVNEVNNIPGALACYIFSEKFDEILDLIIDESIKRERQKQKIKYSYDSSALKVFEEMGNQILKK